MYRSPIITRSIMRCKVCQAVDDEELMVCVKCDMRFHKRCVGLDMVIADEPWYCVNCKPTAAASRITRTTNSSKKEIMLNLLEEERILAEKRDKEYLQKKALILESMGSNRGSLRGSESGSIRDFFDCQINSQQVSTRYSDQNGDQKSRTKAWVDDIQKNRQYHYTSKVSESFFENRSNSRLENLNNIEELQQPLLTSDQFQAPQHKIKKSFPNVSNNDSKYFESVVLTKEQIAARQFMQKDLPSFTGRPEEWPLFISSFERTTKACNFSLEENLVRLQRCLKGHALETVRSRLMLPSAVPSVIETLRLHYGRPEILINNILKGMRSEPLPKAEKLESIIGFALSVQNLCSTMEASGLVAHMTNPTLLSELTERMPPQMRLNWALYQRTTNAFEPNIQILSKWLSDMADAASLVTIPQFGESMQKQDLRSFKNRSQVFVHNEAEVTLSAMTRRQRWDYVKSNKLCSLCLVKHDHHCVSTDVCGEDGCKVKHHRILHKKIVKKTEENSTKNKDQVLNNIQPSIHAHNSTMSQVIFRVVPVILYGKSKTLETFAFLDEGSSLTMLENEVANELELAGTPEKLCLKWTGDTVRVEENSKRVTLKISSSGTNVKIYKMNDVRTVDKLTLPVQNLCMNELIVKYQHLQGLPIKDYKNAMPRILIGLDNWNLGLPLKVREGKWQEPIAAKTRLGWTIHGSQITDTRNNLVLNHVFHSCECNNDEDLNTSIKEYFNTENIGILSEPNMSESVEEKRALEILRSTTILKDNRYETGLLWKTDNIVFPDSYLMAKRRLICLESKMVKDPILSKNLIEQMEQYIIKGYARKLTYSEQTKASPRNWYLPVFTVVNPNKPNKVRMVWDAAAKVNGVSLNSVLLSGPDQLTMLTYVLYGFRQGRYAICGDIKEMFHQVKIKKIDQNSQRFLWRGGEPSREPDVYVMQVMTFGATCSPASAQYVKNENAKRYANSSPRAVECILDHHYVDDMLDSVNTIEEAIKLANEVKRIHASGGFEIRNWISNSTEVLNGINASTITKEHKFCAKDLVGTEKVLGMFWKTDVDQFTYKVNYGKFHSDVISGQRRPSKREVLRIMMSIFDPLGFLAAFMINIKILFQDIWRSSVDWDDKIPEHFFERWLMWMGTLPMIQDIQIPRFYTPTIDHQKRTNTQLHIFVDASENAYAAVAYFRFESKDHIECALVGAKTKVAPLKPLSIPRLELQAAVLGVRLGQYILKGHNNKIDQKIFWSDSQTVIQWIRSDARKYRPFVAFRITEILENSSPEEWLWIPTKHNVADDATKWSKTQVFNSDNRWFQGPEFLRQNEEHWPKKSFESFPVGNEELKIHLQHSIQICYRTTVNLNHFEKWKRLVRAQTCFLRSVKIFLAYTKGEKIDKGPYSLKEIQNGENSLYRLSQVDFFAEEIAILTKSEATELPKNSPLYKLSPYLDDFGVIRIRGRIDRAINVCDDVKRPIVLPKDHLVTMLIIADYHERFHHYNHETVVNEIRQKFYIARLRQVVKKVRFNCQHCKNNRIQPIYPEMAELPSCRLAAYKKPFTYVGVDCFGPITVAVGRRTEKRWGMLFTCMTIRAIHIEIAHSLTTDSCMLCIRNFIARRGLPKKIFSDNGTNFHGASKEIKQSLLDVQEKVTSMEIEWHFNPPGAPHMGGSWERLIGSVKKVLNKIMPTRNPNDELLRSFLVEVESIINCRPLTFVSIEHEDDEALTPNHFLIGSSNGNGSPGHFNEDDLISRKNWRKSQHLANMFWKRWVKEYLPTLTKRTKWFKPTKNIEIGDVVIIIDENLPRNTWLKGRVVEAIRGRDNNVRSAKIKTSNTILERPIVKLAKMEIEK